MLPVDTHVEHYITLRLFLDLKDLHDVQRIARVINEIAVIRYRYIEANCLALIVSELCHAHVHYLLVAHEDFPEVLLLHIFEDGKITVKIRYEPVDVIDAFGEFFFLRAPYLIARIKELLIVLFELRIPILFTDTSERM